MRAIALTYHDVVEKNDYDSSGFLGPDADIYKLSHQEFRSHLQAIHETVRRPAVTLVERTRDWGSACPVLLTFDDGGASAYSAIAEMIEEYGWRGHFFVPTDCIGRAGFLNAKQIRALRQRGHIIGSHSCSHPYRMSALGWDDVVREWNTSCRLLSEILGEPVRVASIPGGYYSRKVASAAATAGIEVLFTSEPTMQAHRIDGCLVLGRYGIRKGTPAEFAAGLVALRFWPRWRQVVVWKVKWAAKFALGEHYIRLRKLLLSRGSPE
jgi:hypothetical protein